MNETVSSEEFNNLCEYRIYACDSSLYMWELGGGEGDCDWLDSKR